MQPDANALRELLLARASGLIHLDSLGPPITTGSEVSLRIDRAFDWNRA